MQNQAEFPMHWPQDPVSACQWPLMLQPETALCQDRRVRAGLCAAQDRQDSTKPPCSSKLYWTLTSRKKARTEDT